MATTYKTPGVYVEEIPKLPPSVAQVETAIPAFVGYTQIAKYQAADDLLNKPTKIGSLVEFELYYGYGPTPVVNKVNIDDANNFLSATVTNKYFLYDSLRMFYSNGGGDCYIVSVGYYTATISDTDINAGIEKLETQDEPTMILYPDAVSLNDNTKLASVQTKALAQCHSLQDRVTIMDLLESDPKGVAFRNNVGINYLSYGAAYTPWLKVALPKTLKYTDVKSVIFRSGILVNLKNLTDDAATKTSIDNLDKVYADITKITAKSVVLSPANGNLRDKFNELADAFNLDATTTTNANLKAIYGYVYSIAAQVDKFIKAGDADELTFATLKTDVTNAVLNNFDPQIKAIKELEKETADIAGFTVTAIAVTAAAWPATTASVAKTALLSGTVDEKRIGSFNNLKPLFDALVISYSTLIVAAANTYAKTNDQALALIFPVYKSILAGASGSMTSMPPSGAIAGVYAAVDNARGVWKAPANVSLANVIEPAVAFKASELDALNVDAVAGKSINAIRSFTGKGTLVFGARTLAGNDNEWRYVPVRRFFNMVEESCKKSTEPFVFEPNDANTWVKIQGMIENFLTTMWRAGALQGAKPEHAFYVAVGLGKTMTSLDILEGRLIVEIGMAVVRPAEFIILRFSHKLAES
jgi:uncharacterized protein